MNAQKGAISTPAAVVILVVILVIAAVAYWYLGSNSPSGATQTNGEASTTAQMGASSSSSGSATLVTKKTGPRLYTNLLYHYLIEIPADAGYNIDNPGNVSFSFKSATNTPDATLTIAVNNDITHLGYCLTIPQGATHVATTTINGVRFLSYVVSGSSSANTGTTYYRALDENDMPYNNVCYDIQKSPQDSAILNSKLNSILESLTFITM